MPKRGTAQCVECNEEIEGIFPDNRPVGRKYLYYWAKGPKEIDYETVTKMGFHHVSTQGEVGRIHGHITFEVFLEDGTKGEAEANTYSVSYRELGKER